MVAHTPIRVVAGLVAVLQLLTFSHALYEDQAGKIDWYRQNVGTILHANFFTDQQRKLVLVSTSVGVVAGLDARGGDTIWRRPLPEGERVITQQFQPKHAVLAVASDRGDGVLMVRLWTTAGELVWDTALRAVGTADDVPAPPFRGGLSFAGDSADVVVSWGSSVRLLLGRSGELAWTWDAASGGAGGVADWRAAQLSEDRETILVSGLHCRSATGPCGPAWATLKAREGEQVALERQSGPGKLRPDSPSAQAADLSHAAYIDEARSLLVVASAAGPGREGRVASLDLKAAGGEGGEGGLSPEALPSAFLVQLAPGHAAVVDVSGLAPQVSRDLPGTSARTCSALRAGDKAVLGCLRRSAHGSVEQTTLLVTATGVEDIANPPAVNIPAARHGELAALFLGAYSARESAGSQRALVVTVDGAAHATDGKEVLWTREEALAEALQVEIASLPRVPPAAERAGPTYGRLPYAAMQLLRSLTAQVGGGAAGSAALQADVFGFRKLILVRSRLPKVFALDSDGGGLVWSYLPAAGEGAVEVVALDVVPGGDSGGPVAQVITRSGATYAVHTLDALTGTPVTPPAAVGSRVVWALPGDSEARALVLDDMSVTVIPGTADAARRFAATAAGAYFYLADPEAGAIQGYGIRQVAGSPADHPRFRAQLRWTHVLPPGAEGVTLARPDPAEAVHAPVRVLGDRSVLHKYLNANLVGVAYTEPVAAERFAVSGDRAVHVTLLDGVTGAPVYDLAQPRSTGPVQLAISENMAVVHARSSSAVQHVVSVVELYENATAPEFARMLFTGDRGDLDKPQSAFERRRPYALSQAYYFPTSVHAIAVTQTAKGITPRHVLFAQSDGQLLALDKRIIDPRRPLQAPSAADKEEGLAQYTPSIGMPPRQAVITHGQAVARPRGIRCASTVLESTTVIAYFGVDLFVALYSPAKTFDKLGESFNYGALVLAVGGLAVLTVASTFMRQRKEVNQLWR